MTIKYDDKIESISEISHESKILNETIQDYLSDISKLAYKFNKERTTENAVWLAWEANRVIERLESLNYMVMDKLTEIEETADAHE